MGTPAAVYHGGLLHARVRYFDPVCQRPGLPEHVAALVSRIRPDGLRVTLVNLDPLANREVVLQAGTFGEHEFTSARIVDDPKREHPSVAIHSKHLKVRLGPSAQAGIEIAMRRYAHTPSYAFPTLS
jgi:hypothetical protein